MQTGKKQDSSLGAHPANTFPSEDFPTPVKSYESKLKITQYDKFSQAGERKGSCIVVFSVDLVRKEELNLMLKVLDF